jgi:hypothetical protein
VISLCGSFEYRFFRVGDLRDTWEYFGSFFLVFIEFFFLFGKCEVIMVSCGYRVGLYFFCIAREGVRC